MFKFTGIDENGEAILSALSPAEAAEFAALVQSTSN